MTVQRALNWATNERALLCVERTVTATSRVSPRESRDTPVTIHSTGRNSISCTREKRLSISPPVKRPRGPNAQCRVDLGFAGFSLSFPESVIKHTQRCARPGGCACTALCPVPVQIFPHSYSHSISCPAVRRGSKLVRDPVFRLPLFTLVLYLSLCGSRTAHNRLHFPQFPFSLVLSTTDLPICTRPRNAPKLASPLAMLRKQDTRGRHKSEHFQKQLVFIENVARITRRERTAESSRETISRSSRQASVRYYVSCPHDSSEIRSQLHTDAQTAINSRCGPMRIASERRRTMRELS